MFRLALQKAQEAGLDLVEIAPNSSPPVCKLLDYGKYKYQAQKKAAEARKKQKVVEVKEIKLRPMIDDHDYDVKMRSMQRFFEEGDKVKVTLRFRGREMAHQELGYQLLNRVKDDTLKIAKVEQEPRFEGRQVVMVLAAALKARAPMAVGLGEFHAHRNAGANADCSSARALCHKPVLPPPGCQGCRGDGKAQQQLERATSGPPGSHPCSAAKESQMPKIKTKSGAKKRFKVTAAGRCFISSPASATA